MSFCAASAGVLQSFDVGVGQHFVEEDLLGNVLPPRHQLARAIGEIGIGEEEFGLEGMEIGLGHVGDEEGHARALFARHPCECLLQFRPVVLGRGERLLDIVGPPLRGWLSESGRGPA